MHSLTTVALALAASTASAELTTGRAFTIQAQLISWGSSNPSIDKFGLSVDSRSDAALTLDNHAIFAYNGTAEDIEKGLSGIVNTQTHKTLGINNYPMYTPKDISEAQPLPDGTFFIDPRHGTTFQRVYLSAPQDPYSYLLPNQFLVEKDGNTRYIHNGDAIFYNVNQDNSTLAEVRLYPVCAEPAEHTLDGLATIPVRCYRPGTQPGQN